MSTLETFDVVVVGGGPTGATAASDLAKKGRKVLLLDRMGRIKPCGGAIPPRLIKDFEIPDELLVAKANCARMIAPSDKAVDMHIEGGFVGMVDRDKFDEFCVFVPPMMVLKEERASSRKSLGIKMESQSFTMLCGASMVRR